MDLRTSLFILCTFYLAECDEDVDTHPNWKYVPENCGTTKGNQFRIYGGQDAELGQFPWLVKIKGEQYKTQGFICGGAIISPRHVITAAHCGDGIKIISVRLGEYDTDKDVDCNNLGCAPPPQDIEVEYYRQHPEWNKTILHNDIALMKLVKDAEFNDYVQPLCLPGHNNFFENYVPSGDVKLAGWGYANIDSDDATVPSILRFVNLKINPISFCSKHFPKYRTSFNAKDQICIGMPDGKDTCEGDSGGPVMQEIKVDNDYRTYCLGVVSFGSATCGSAPAVYTNVRRYLKWILDNM